MHYVHTSSMHSAQVCPARVCCSQELLEKHIFEAIPEVVGHAVMKTSPMLVSGQLDMRLLRQERARRAVDSCLQGHKLYKSSFIHSGRFMEAWPLEIKTQYAKEYPWKRRRRRRQLSVVVSTQLFTILLHSSSLQQGVKQKCAAALAMLCTTESSPSQDLNIKRGFRYSRQTPPPSAQKHVDLKAVFLISSGKQQIYWFWIYFL